MLTYTYECKRCGAFEHEQRISDPRLERCPTCKKPVKRLIEGGQGFITKGGGGSIKGQGCSHTGSCASCGSGCASCGH
jgi:putative FmdB family regulatory protein